MLYEKIGRLYSPIPEISYFGKTLMKVPEDWSSVPHIEVNGYYKPNPIIGEPTILGRRVILTGDIVLGSDRDTGTYAMILADVLDLNGFTIRAQYGSGFYNTMPGWSYNPRGHSRPTWMSLDYQGFPFIMYGGWGEVGLWNYVNPPYPPAKGSGSQGTRDWWNGWIGNPGGGAVIIQANSIIGPGKIKSDAPSDVGWASGGGGTINLFCKAFDSRVELTVARSGVGVYDASSDGSIGIWTFDRDGALTLMTCKSTYHLKNGGCGWEGIPIFGDTIQSFREL